MVTLLRTVDRSFTAMTLSLSRHGFDSGIVGGKRVVEGHLVVVEPQVLPALRRGVQSWPCGSARR